MRGPERCTTASWLSAHYSRDVKNALIDFYGQFDDVESAQAVFDSTGDADKDIVSVNSMLKALCSRGLNAECLALFDEFIHSNLMCDAIIFSCALRSCTQGAEGRQDSEIQSTMSTCCTRRWCRCSW